MIGYIYRITIINKESKLQGKNYIGLHLSKNFDNQYFGSGRIIKDYRKKHGQKGLHKEILDFSDDLEELMNLEVYYISMEIGLFNNINIQKGGRLGNTGVSYRKGYVLSEEIRKKISDGRRKNPRIYTDYEKQLLSKKYSGKGNHMYGKNVKDLMSEEKYKSMLKNRSIAMTGKLVGEKNPSFNKNVKDSDIIKLKNEGCSINEISEKLECNYSLVYARLKNLNIDTNKKIVNKEEVKDILNKGCSVKETSKLLKCTESRIYQIKRELKI